MISASTLYPITNEYDTAGPKQYINFYHILNSYRTGYSSVLYCTVLYFAKIQIPRLSYPSRYHNRLSSPSSKRTPLDYTPTQNHLPKASLRPQRILHVLPFLAQPPVFPFPNHHAAPPASLLSNMSPDPPSPSGGTPAAEPRQSPLQRALQRVAVPEERLDLQLLGLLRPSSRDRAARAGEAAGDAQGADAEGGSRFGRESGSGSGSGSGSVGVVDVEKGNVGRVVKGGDGDGEVMMPANGDGDGDGDVLGRAEDGGKEGAEGEKRTSASLDYPVRAPREFRPAELSFGELKEVHGGSVAAGFAMARRFVRRYYGILLFFVLLQVGLVLLGVLAFEPLTWKAWVAFEIVSVALTLLIINALPTEVVMSGALTAMLLFQIITPREALTGFSNTGVASVAVLFIVADGIQRTSVLLPLFRFMLGKPNSLAVAQLRLMLPVALISAFLNNTPVVAMLISVVQSWSRRAGFPISKLLMPLNNAAILGGTMTLLGTSTNLVVKGLADDAGIVDKDGNKVVIPLFGITPVGSALLLVGIVYMLIASRFLLRNRGRQGVGAIIKNPREYTVPLRVTERSPIVGETVTSAGLRQLQGLFLVEVTREDGTVIPAVPPETKIRAEDTLLFAGVVETVTELYHIPGIVPATSQSTKMTQERHRRRLVELVISPSSFLVGKTAKEARFRSRFDSAIIAVHRRGEHVKEKIADITFYPGDTLLVETSASFIKHYGRDSNFALVSEVSGSQPPRTDILHMVLSAVIVIAMVAVVTAGVLDLLTGAAVASVLLIVTGCMSLSNAGEAVNVPVIITIAASFGVSKGMEVSGAAGALANFIVDSFKGIGKIGLLFGVYIGTALLSSVLTNNAAVSLYFPVIATILKKDPDLNPFAALYALMIGASSSFSTPIGYQT